MEKAGKTCGNKLSTKMQNPQVTHSSFRLCGKQDSKVGEFYIDKTLSDVILSKYVYAHNHYFDGGVTK